MSNEEAAPRRAFVRGAWARWNSGVWNRRDYRNLWTASTVSAFGTLISRTAIPFAAILELDASPLQIAALGACEMAPAFAVGLFAGAWVDRLPRKPIMIAADLGRAALLLLIPLMALLDSPLPESLTSLLAVEELVALRRRARAIVTDRVFPIDGTGRRYPWPLV